jgi:hypothetical protein
MNSIEFRSAILSTRFSSANGFTSLDIYSLIMNGAEILSGENDHEIDIAVELYEKNNSTVGYTNEKTPWTWINNKFFKSFDTAEVAGNIVHEWVHKLGFDHESAKEITSVPYAVGYIVRNMIHELHKGRIFGQLWWSEEHIPVPVKQKAYVCKRSWRTFFRKVCWYE